MLRIPTELEDIPLCNSKVFEKLPGRVRRVCRFDPLQFERDSAQNILIIQMGLTATEKFQ
jgi:hypothetical protein